ncbi:MAG: UDP-N-acetylmuramoyl-L-alanine--D-glutamate ligase, partial [Spirochaetes bacterium]|nr:UDP-N-acetylmuramoyl-L-alanine--D-glutamate ligase [Spirochaetota bacterium]
KLRPMLEADGIAYAGPFDKLPEAVAAARKAATAGSIVVLSPGCTSFGMFKNEFDRGNSFKQTVTALYADG